MKNIGVIRKLNEQKFVILYDGGFYRREDGYNRNYASVIEFNNEDAYDNLSEFDIITFVKNDIDNTNKHFKATEIQLATSIKSELIHQLKEEISIDYSFINRTPNCIAKTRREWFLLIGKINELYEIYFEFFMKDLYVYLNVEAYLNSIDIESIILNFKTIIKSSGNFRAGKDETTHIFIASSGINFEYINDDYLSNFLTVKEHIESITDFASWQTTATEYIAANKEILDNLVKSKRETLISDIKTKYKKTDHRITLIRQLDSSLTKNKSKIDKWIKEMTEDYYYNSKI